MTYHDDDQWADVEALESEQLDADLLQSQLDRAGNAAARARKAGRCTHGSVDGYRSGQPGLRPGQSRCADGCERVFASDKAWYAAMAAAVRGPQ